MHHWTALTSVRHLFSPAEETGFWNHCNLVGITWAAEFSFHFSCYCFCFPRFQRRESIPGYDSMYSPEGQRIYLSSQCTFRSQYPFLLMSLNLAGHEVPQNQSLSGVHPTDYVYSEFNIRAVLLFPSYVHPGTHVYFLTRIFLHTCLTWWDFSSYTINLEKHFSIRVGKMMENAVPQLCMGSSRIITVSGMDLHEGLACSD